MPKPRKSGDFTRPTYVDSVRSPAQAIRKAARSAPLPERVCAQLFENSFLAALAVLLKVLTLPLQVLVTLS